MARQLFFGLIKFSMMSAPFLSMLMMILALWGVAGKATYIDLETAKQGMEFGANEAKNFLVSDTKNSGQCPEELKNLDIGQEKENPMPTKIDWEHVV
ncbi:MAG: hypothetical protein ACU83V_06415 [Gammaproteobacteria bacterium]